MRLTAYFVRAGWLISVIFLLGVSVVSDGHGQCILANPSFEVDGSGGEIFGGWGQFGQTGVVTATTTHGSKAARASGPGGDSWDVSGYWQRLDSAPGEQWEVTGQVQHPSSNPLTGACIALVNVEWRNAGGDLIDYHSFAVADPDTPTDEYIGFSVLSDPAPAGTAAIHFVVGVLDSPSDPSADCYFDQVTIFSTNSPTMDEMQWNDFNGGRTIDFSNRSWRVKGPGYYGPGPNVFSNEADCVWVDSQGQLHLTLSNRGSHWASTEVTLEEALGYGDYIVTTVGRLDIIDIQAVLGIFLWQYGPCWDNAYLWWNPYNEIDIEYSRWGDPARDIAQFVAQPYYWGGNTERFEVTFDEGDLTSHAMRWLADRVEYRVWRGGPQDESPETMVHSWNYSGPHIPRPEQPRMHLNLWKLEGTPTVDQEVIFQSFNFEPEAGVSDVAEFDWSERETPLAALTQAGPNPFNPETSIKLDLAREAYVELGVYSLSGRLVRSLQRGVLGGGMHSASWNGLDDQGREVTSGVYLIRLSGEGFSDTRRVVRIR